MSRAGRRAIGAKDQDSTAAELGGPRYRTASCTMVRIVRIPEDSMARAKTRPNVPVFVSSTFTDMQAYRRKVRDALTQLEAVVRGMEQFGSKPGSPVEECLQVVQSCRLYVGVFGMRYPREHTARRRAAQF